MSNKEFLKVLKDNGLQLFGGGASVTDLSDNLDDVVRSSRELGIETFMIGVGGELKKANGDWRGVVARLKRVCAEAAAAGLKILYHNHAFEFESKVDGVYGFDYIFREIPSAHIQAEIDVYWVKTGGEDPVAYINAYAGRLPRLHIKDRAPAPADETCPFAEVGHGILDWDAIFAAAEKAGVEWYVVEQDRCVRSPLESARMSIEYLKSRGML